MTNLGKLKTTAIAGFAIGMISTAASADQVILDDLIVDGSICAGFDCVNGESFGFDTLRLKENNLRIGAVDTSTSASFPSNDWQLTFNDSSNGGANKFSVDDITGGSTPFTIEASARNHSLYVDDGGRIGIGTATPVVRVHQKDGNTPTLRLEQDGSSGFTPQTWDMAGNEANFFIRDVTNGSKLSFRIRPGAPESSIDIAADGDIGIGSSSPQASLHISRGANNSSILLDSATADWLIENKDASGRFNIGINGGNTMFKIDETANSNLLRLGATGVDIVDIDGSVVVTGTLTTGTGNTCENGCDRVFDETYDLPTIQEHAAAMYANSFLPNVGPTPDDAPTINITEKIGGMLNELEHAHIYIDQMNQEMQKQRETIAALALRVEQLEK